MASKGRFHTRVQLPIPTGILFLELVLPAFGSALTGPAMFPPAITGIDEMQKLAG